MVSSIKSQVRLSTPCEAEFLNFHFIFMNSRTFLFHTFGIFKEATSSSTPNSQNFEVIPFRIFLNKTKKKNIKQTRFLVSNIAKYPNIVMIVSNQQLHLLIPVLNIQHHRSIIRNTTANTNSVDLPKCIYHSVTL